MESRQNIPISTQLINQLLAFDSSDNKIFASQQWDRLIKEMKAEKGCQTHNTVIHLLKLSRF